ncbi:MAG: adenylate/guanylate cyclase domain-containing protein [Nannocystaceae bacterium]
MRGRRVFAPELTEPHLGNVYAMAMIAEFDASIGAAAVDRAIEEAGLSRDYLADLERWASIPFHARFADALARQVGLTEPPPYEHPFWEHWRRGAWRIAEVSMGSLVWLRAWAMERPSRYFAEIGQLYTTANQLTRVHFVDQGEGWSRIEVHESRRYESRPAGCWSRRGLFERVPAMWGLPPATVEHPRCVHRDPGVEACTYVIRYDESSGPPASVELPRIAGLVRQHLGAVFGRQQATFREHRRALLEQRKIASYLPATALWAIEVDPERELALGGQRCDGAVLFADIVGYTRRFATADAEAVVEQLNLYFEAVDPVIAAHGGIVDKRMGDGIMAVFVAVEAPRTLSSLAASAVRCGLEVLRVVRRCSAAIEADGGAPLKLRVGVAAGSLVQGNLGSRTRMEYTVIGEPVNLAARLQSAATIGRLLTTTACLVEAPALAAVGAPRRITAKGIGEVEVVELDPDRVDLAASAPPEG